MSETGSNEQSAAQGSESQSAGAGDKGSNEQSAAQATQAQQAQQTIDIEEYNKAKTATVELVKKKDHWKALAEKLKEENEALAREAASKSTDPEEQARMWEEMFEKQKTEITTLKQQARKKDVGDKVITAAAKMNAINPELVLRIVDHDIIFDEANRAVINDGKGEPLINKETMKPYTINEHVTQVLRENPNLVRSSGQTGAGSTATKTGTSQQFTREAIRKMSPEDYQKNKAAIHRQYYGK